MQEEVETIKANIGDTITIYQAPPREFKRLIELNNRLIEHSKQVLEQNKQLLAKVEELDKRLKKLERYTQE